MSSGAKRVVWLLALVAFFSVVYVHIAEKHDDLLASSALLRGIMGQSDLYYSNRVAILWVFGGFALPSYFDLAVYSLFAHRTDLQFDLHVITGAQVPHSLDSFRMWSPYKDRIFFHVCTAGEWHERISSKIGVSINYTLESKGRKIADLKPMLADLFPDIVDENRYGWWVYGDCDGFFGSYDRIFRYDALFNYDVVTGASNPIGKSIDKFGYGGYEHYSIGSWTMLRNNHIVNTLYKRSVNYLSMVQDGNKVYSFDENTHVIIPGVRESFHDVLERSTDIKQCSDSNSNPEVRHDAEKSLIVVDMDGEFVTNDVMTVIRWERNALTSVSIVGHLGRRTNAYVNQTCSGLFVHLLQWKYIRPTLFKLKLSQLNSAVGDMVVTQRKPVDCFEFIVDSKEYKNDALYSWRLC